MEITPGELKKLAEIAGVRITIFSNVLYYHLDGKPIVISTEFIWQPHLRIEQAMIVADTFVEWELRKTSEKRYYSFVVSDDLENYYDATEDTASLSLCRAALAAKEDK